MIRSAVKVTAVTRSEAKHRTVATPPVNRVATQGEWKEGWTRPRARLTGAGQALSLALAHRMRENCRVMARMALRMAHSAPKMMMFLAVLPQTLPTRSVSGVALE